MGQKSLTIVGGVIKTIEEKYIPTAIVNGLQMQFQYYVPNGSHRAGDYYTGDGNLVKGWVGKNLVSPKMVGTVLLDSGPYGITFYYVNGVFDKAFLCEVSYLNDREGEVCIYGANEEAVANAARIMELSETDPNS